MTNTDKLTIEDFPPELIERLAQRCMELVGITPNKHSLVYEDNKITAYEGTTSSLLIKDTKTKPSGETK